MDECRAVPLSAVAWRRYGAGMSEPREIAERAEPVIDGVWHWHISNSAIGGAMSSSQAITADGGSVLVDPVQLDPEELAGLREPTAIVLTSKGHQRSAWHYRSEFGAEVWMPEGAAEADEQPDHRYRDGDQLPGGLRAVLTPGPAPVHYCMLLERAPGVLICSDLLSNSDDGLEFVNPAFHDDPAETRRSVERLLDLPFAVMCFDHGVPITDDPKGDIKTLLAKSAG